MFSADCNYLNEEDIEVSVPSPLCNQESLKIEDEYTGTAFLDDLEFEMEESFHGDDDIVDEVLGDIIEDTLMCANEIKAPDNDAKCEEPIIDDLEVHNSDEVEHGEKDLDITLPSLPESSLDSNDFDGSGLAIEDSATMTDNMEAFPVDLNDGKNKESLIKDLEVHKSDEEDHGEIEISLPEAIHESTMEDSTRMTDNVDVKAFQENLNVSEDVIIEEEFDYTKKRNGTEKDEHNNGVEQGSKTGDENNLIPETKSFAEEEEDIEIVEEFEVSNPEGNFNDVAFEVVDGGSEDYSPVQNESEPNQKKDINHGELATVHNVAPSQNEDVEEGEEFLESDEVSTNKSGYVKSTSNAVNQK